MHPNPAKPGEFDSAEKHVGSFSAWTEKDGVKKLFAVTSQPTPKVPRWMKRTIKAYCAKDFNVNLMSSAQRKSATQLLTLAAKLLMRRA